MVPNYISDPKSKFVIYPLVAKQVARGSFKNLNKTGVDTMVNRRKIGTHTQKS